MTIRVLLFARYREAAGVPAVQVDVPSGATLGEIWERVRQRVPGLRHETTPLFACDQAYARADQPVASDREIAAFPPVSGG